MIAALRAWWRNRCINSLLVERAGLQSAIEAHKLAGNVSWVTYQQLGQVNERLRQAGYKEAP